MSNTLEKNPLIARLVPAAKSGKTVSTTTFSTMDECFYLSKEGFYIHPISYDFRHSQHEIKVEWTHPLSPNGAAAKLLSISQKSSRSTICNLNNSV